MASRQENRILLVVVTAGVVVVWALVTFSGAMEETPVDRRIRERTEKSEQQSRRRSNDETEARTFAEQFVRQSLKAPSTAKFGPYSSVKVTPMGGGAWTVIGYVDAQNSYGASLRSQWSVLLQKEGDRWRAVSVDVN